MKDDVFAPVPEFLAAFRNILENGFFEDVQFSVSGKMCEGKIIGCTISATGCVPNDKQFMATGCGAIVDPAALIESCRKLTGAQKVQDLSTKVETKNWTQYDTAGERAIGSKGSRTEMSLFITFEH